MAQPIVTTDEGIGAPAPAGVVAQPWWLWLAVVWQVAVAVAGILGGIGVITGAVLNLGGLGLVLVAALLLAGGALSAASVWWMLRHQHRGRAAAMLLDYLVAVVAGFVALQEVGFFTGLDAFAVEFRNSVFLLLLVLLGWLVLGQADRFPSQANVLRTAGRWIMIVGGVAVLLRSNAIAGVATFLSRIIEPEALVPTLIMAMSILVFVLLRRSAADLLFETTRSQAEAIDGFLFASPNLLGFLAFFAFPLAFSFFVALTSWDGLGDIEFIGLDNYIEIFSLQFVTVAEGQPVSEALSLGYTQLISFGDFVIGARDRLFWIGLRNIIVFGLVAIPLSIIPALFLASLLNTKIPGVKVFRAVYFIPAIAGVVGIALIWKQLYNASVGFINYFISRFVDLLNLIPGLDLTAPQPEWLSSPNTALLSVIIVFAWQTIGFNTVLYLAGMQGISKSLYEAAEIDGAGAWSKFRRITVPMLRPTTLFVVATTTILALQLFNEPFILFAPQQQPSGPNNSTLSPVIHLYQEAFQRFNQGYASALAWVLFVLIFGLTLVYFWRSSDEEGS